MLIGWRAFFADPRGRTNTAYWLLLTGLFLFSGFRWEVGCDWSGYARHWFLNRSDFWEIVRGREAGHWLLIHALQRLGLPYYSLNVATSAIFFWGLHVLARRQPDPIGFLVLAFPILIINMPMSGIRQGVAIGLICLAFAAFLDKRPLVFLGWVAAGSLFHSSALAFLPLVAFIYGKFSLTTLLRGLFLSLPALYFVLQSEAADVAVTRYIGTGIESFGAPYRLALLLITGVAYFWLAYRAWQKRFPTDHTLVSIGAVMMIGVGLLIPLSSTIGDRIGYYLVPLQLMIFARLSFLFRGEGRSMMTASPYLLLGMVFIVWTQTSRHFELCYLPYDTVLLH